LFHSLLVNHFERELSTATATAQAFANYQRYIYFNFMVNFTDRLLLGYKVGDLVRYHCKTESGNWEHGFTCNVKKHFAFKK
jgi:hypothetical protein